MAVLFGLAGLGLSLVVLIVLPTLAGQPFPSTALVVAQAVAIAVGIALVFSWLSGVGAAGKTTADGPSAKGGDGVVRTDIDASTGLLNQRGLTVKLLELMALGERYGNHMSVAIIGIDHLDDVRERYGPAGAEKGLTAIAGELADTLRLPDRLGRWSEDQLLLILPETSIDGARHIGERLREAASRTQFEVKRGVVLTLTASIGVTVFRMGDDLQGLLSRAGRAMKSAREQGCNRVLTDLAA